MQTEDHSQTLPLSAPTRPKNTRPPLPENYKALCRLVREGRLFEVQQWFKDNRYEEPEQYTSVHWPMGIAIEKGFHSMVEVLLQNGIPADYSALQRATAFRKAGLVDLLFLYGATVDMVDLDSVVWTGDRAIILKFISLGADLVTGYPIATGLIRHTKLFLGIYKSLINQHPYLQFQADMALLHFCEATNLRGVSLLMWLGASPRNKVPRDANEPEDQWTAPLSAAALLGNLDVIKRLKPDRTTDDVNALLRRGIGRSNMELVRYWISLGADINCSGEDHLPNHREVFWHLGWALTSHGIFYSTSDKTAAKTFAIEWFSSGAKWPPAKDDVRVIRKVLGLLSDLEAYEFIKLLLIKAVMNSEDMGQILDNPKLRQHLKERRFAVVKLIPTLRKWLN
jgi:hypothetical protein